VADMAMAITGSQLKQLDEKDLNRILTDLEALSDEEARTLADEGKLTTTKDQARGR